MGQRIKLALLIAVGVFVVGCNSEAPTVATDPNAAPEAGQTAKGGVEMQSRGLSEAGKGAEARVGSGMK
jgi:hypothetical protein